MAKKLLKASTLFVALVLFCATCMIPTAMAADIQPRYSNVGTASGSISYAGQKITVTITGVSDVTQISVSATLYEVGLFGGTQEVASLSTSSSSSSCYGEKGCTIRKGKSYRLEISASAYMNGSWEPITNTVTASF